MRYTHILLDHDGVLVDTEPLYFRATREELAEHGVPIAEAEFLALQADGRTARGQMAAAGYSAEEVDQARARRNARYQQLLCTESIDIPGVADTLAQLKNRFRLAIVTTARPQDFNLIHYGEVSPARDAQPRRAIVEHMDFVLVNGDYGRSKPAPDPYLAGLERFGITASQALVVEDSERGLKAAVAAGIDCAVVHHPFTATQCFDGAAYRLQTFSELLEIVHG